MTGSLRQDLLCLSTFLDTGPWGLEVPGVPRALGLTGAQTEGAARCSGEKNLARKRERLKKW